MDPAEAARVLAGLERFGMRFRLDAVEGMLRALGNPERELDALHVGGTNGKGSVCSFLTHACMATGKTVGTYTSPHLVRFEERIAVQARPIEPAKTAELLERCLPAIERARKAGQEPTYFEVATLMAFEHFAARRVDVAVVEVGLGGRLDATNALQRPLCSVVTNVSLDHTDVLGPTVERIAWDKGHILKPGRPGVTGAEGPALLALQQVARERGAPLRTLDGMAIEPLAANLDKQVFELRSPWRDYGKLEIALLGAHQLQNAALAVAALEEAAGEGLEVPPAALRRGLAQATWPGRLQVLSRDPDVILDGAHNPAGSEALAQFVRQHRGRWPHVALVLGVLADKDYARIAGQLAPLADVVVATEPPSPRRLPAASLAEAVRPHARRVETELDPLRAVERARTLCPPGGLVLVAGSLYLAGAVLAAR